MRISDWSSDVCSSDLQDARHVEGRPQRTAQAVARDDAGAAPAVGRTKPARGALSRQVACKLLQGSRGNQPAGRSGQTVFASSSSSQSKTSAPSSSSSETKLNTLRAYISLACSAPLLARFSGPATVTPLLSMVSPGCVRPQLPPVSAARSDT